jgi:uncharacterized protein
MKGFWRGIGVGLLTLYLGGCVSLSTSQFEHAVLLPKTQYTAKQYLAKAEQATTPQREAYILQAANYLIKDASYARAAQLLKSLDNKSLSAQLRRAKQLTQAYLFNSTQRPRRALSVLSTINPDTELNLDHKIFYHDLLAHAYLAEHQPLPSVAERLKLSQLLTNEAQRQWNTRQIWQILQHQPLVFLDAARMETEDQDMQAWLELAYRSKKYGSDATALQAALLDWQQQHPNHIARQVLLRKTEAPIIINKTPENIALLLPLTGPYAGAANAIRDGFLARYYELKEHANIESITIYDTHQHNVAQILQHAQANDVNFVIGPLRKERVDHLANQPLNIPTLALNYADKQQKPIERFYQFGISPLDEAQQAAIKAKLDGTKRALLIFPNGKWGQSIAAAFKRQWTQLGGETAAELIYRNKTNLRRKIQDTLYITRSFQRRSHLEKTIHQKPKFFPRRRQDIDMIFLVANPTHAQQIRPLLKFYYAGSIPIYATSALYTYAKHANKDIEGIYFCDIPWLIDPQHEQIASKILAPLTNYKKNRHARFYALGYDALLVATRLHQLHTFPAVGVEGATGHLYLDSLGKIHRELLWAEIKNNAIHSI